MSRKRNRHLSLSSVLDKTQSTLKGRTKPIFGVSTTKSFYIPNNNSTLSNGKRVDFTDHGRQRMFNKNVSYFRDISGPDDPGMLHFMSSLRQNQTLENNASRRMTESQPFDVAAKQTMNQTFRKRIFESTAKQSRISTAYYRWHNNSGKGTTTCVDFQCSLRDYNMGMNPEESKFSNLIKPIKYQQVEPKMYDDQQIVCPRQRKLFRLKAK